MSINSNFTIDEINLILNALAVQPYGQVKDLIERLQAEANEQIAAQQENNSGVEVERP